MKAKNYKSKLIDKIMSEITPEEQAKTDGEMLLELHKEQARKYADRVYYSSNRDEWHAAYYGYLRCLQDAEKLSESQKDEDSRVNASLHGVIDTLPCANLIKSLGEPIEDNTYIVKPDKDGKWWIEHTEVGSAQPLKQWLTGKPQGSGL